MKKLKWKYSPKDKQWYINESVAYANDGIRITKRDKEFKLCFDCHISTFRFKKLSSAKEVAQLIFNG